MNAHVIPLIIVSSSRPTNHRRHTMARSYYVYLSPLLIILPSPTHPLASFIWHHHCAMTTIIFLVIIWFGMTTNEPCSDISHKDTQMIESFIRLMDTLLRFIFRHVVSPSCVRSMHSRMMKTHIENLYTYILTHYSSIYILYLTMKPHVQPNVTTIYVLWQWFTTSFTITIRSCISHIIPWLSDEQSKALRTAHNTYDHVIHHISIDALTIFSISRPTMPLFKFQ